MPNISPLRVIAVTIPCRRANLRARVHGGFTVAIARLGAEELTRRSENPSLPLSAAYRSRLKRYAAPTCASAMRKRRYCAGGINLHRNALRHCGRVEALPRRPSAALNTGISTSRIQRKR